jgi:hypothetical protein
MEPRTKHLKTDVNSPISILPFHVSTNIFWFSVLEITAPQNDNFWCVRRERKKKKLDGTRVELVCEMRCEAVSNVDYREIEISYERNNRVYDWIRNVLFGKIFLVYRIQFYFPINIVRNIKCQSVSPSWKSRDYDIYFYENSVSE